MKIDHSLSPAPFLLAVVSPASCLSYYDAPTVANCPPLKKWYFWKKRKSFQKEAGEESEGYIQDAKLPQQQKHINKR